MASPYDAEAFSALAVQLAAEDPDLVAFFELKNLGYTDRVGPSRADALEDYPVQQLRQEVQREYCLTERDMSKAVIACLEGIGKRRYSVE